MNRQKLFQTFPIIETENLRLRQLYAQSDSNVIFTELYNDRDVSKWYQDDVTGEFSMFSKLEHWDREYFNERIIVWGIELKSTKELIGIRFCQVFETTHSAYLECRLSRKHWGRGLMTEATCAIIDFLESSDIYQIFTIIHPENTRALKLDRKLGFLELPISEFYISDNQTFHEKITLNGLFATVQNSGEKLFVLPKIDKNAFKYFELANIFRLRNDISRSIEFAIKSIEYQSDFVHSLNRLGWDLLDTGSHSKAINIFLKIIAMKPKKTSAILGLAYAYSDANEVSLAINYYKKYLLIENLDDETYVVFGNLLFNNGYFKEAFDAYNQALKANPNNPHAAGNRNEALKYIR